MSINGVAFGAMVGAAVGKNTAEDKLNLPKNEEIKIDFKSKTDNLSPTAKGAVLGAAIGTVIPGIGTFAGAAAGTVTGKAVDKVEHGDKSDAAKICGGAAAGAAIGSVVPGLGTLIGAGVGAIVGLFL